MFKPFASLKAKKNMTVLFLASHGLRSQLSTIRWACSRLRKAIGGPLSKEQRQLINAAYTHTVSLTTALNALLLVGRIEEKEYVPHSEIIDLHPFIDAAAQHASEHGRDWSITMGALSPIRGDHAVVQMIFDVLSELCKEATESPHVFVEVQNRGSDVELSLHAAWEMPLLTLARTTSSSGSSQLLGGTIGLMLSLAQELASAIGGTLELQEVATGAETFISDGTVESPEVSQEDFRVVVRLPRAA